MAGTRFFVIDGEGYVSFKDEDPESFPTYAAASRRARLLAQDNPGTQITICKSIAVASATVLSPSIDKV